MSISLKSDEIAIVFLNNLQEVLWQSKLRRDFLESIKTAEGDPKVLAIILCINGEKESFGANEESLTTHQLASTESHSDLIEVIETLEKCCKPTIAAVKEYALGEHLELILGCHYRTALLSAKFGLPQVKFGKIPGCGGTQRLPRLIGLDFALQWIVYGAEHSAEVATKVGLIDKLFAENADIVESSILFAHSIIGKSILDRQVSAYSIKDKTLSEHLISKHKMDLARKSVTALSPFVCLQTTSLASCLPYKNGLMKEREALQFLVSSGQFKAIQYAHECEKQVCKWKISEQINFNTVLPTEVKKAAVIGLGTMGSGIAISIAKAGIPVIVLELDAKLLKDRVEFIQLTIKRMRSREEITRKQYLYMQSAIRPTSHFLDLKDVDLVIEAVFESMELKKEIFNRLDKVCKQSTILATNTSSFDIDEIASVTQRPQQVIGMHFFAPAHRMRLLENIRGLKSSPRTISTSMELGSRMEKVTVLVGNCDGFVGNRMYFHYLNESDFLLEEGAYPDQVDQVLKKFGFTMGRYEVGDMSGNDVGYRVRFGQGFTQKQQPPGTKERERNGVRYCPLADILVESGRHGHKTNGKGWFKYIDRKPHVDEEVTQMIDLYRTRHNIKPRKIQSEEILQRLLYPMINEGFKILEEGIASQPYDIDMVWVYGYAWPKHTGGPMYYAHTVGLPRILQVIDEHWRTSGESEPHWKPSTLLINLVQNHGNPDIHQWMHLGKSVRSVL